MGQRFQLFFDIWVLAAIDADGAASHGSPSDAHDADRRQRATHASLGGLRKTGDPKDRHLNAAVERAVFVFQRIIGLCLVVLGCLSRRLAPEIDEL